MAFVARKPQACCHPMHRLYMSYEVGLDFDLILNDRIAAFLTAQK